MEKDIEDLKERVAKNFRCNHDRCRSLCDYCGIVSCYECEPDDDMRIPTDTCYAEKCDVTFCYDCREKYAYSIMVPYKCKIYFCEKHKPPH